MDDFTYSSEQGENVRILEESSSAAWLWVRKPSG